MVDRHSSVGRSALSTQPGNDRDDAVERGRKSEPRAKPTKVPRLCSKSRKVIKQARERAQQAGEDSTLVMLAEHAAMIRRLGKRVADDIIEIGRRLHIAKSLVGHGNWGPWLDREFGWTDDTALNFMRVYELSGDLKSRNFRDLKIAPSALYLIARKSTPETVKNEVIARAEAGEAITVKTVKDALAEYDDDDQDVSGFSWLGRVTVEANKTIGLAKDGHNANFELDDAQMKIIREATHAWAQIAAECEQRWRPKQEREAAEPEHEPEQVH